MPPPQQTRLWVLYCLALGLVFLSALLPFPFYLIVLGSAMFAIPALHIHQAQLRYQSDLQAQRVTERVEQAESATGLLRNLIDSADIPILATDHLGNISHLNHQAERVLGLGTSMLGRAFDEIMTQSALHELEAAARSGEPGHARLALAIVGEIRDFDVSADPMNLPNTHTSTQTSGAVLTFRDITELSRAMTLKADFVANASHELRTPIASIKGATETLAGPAKDDERMSARLVEMIATNANRLELLATDLLDLSKLEAEDQPPTLETVSTSAVFDKVLSELLSPAEHRGLMLVPEIEDGLDELLTDRSMLALMLRNLVGNAIKFAHQETAIRIVAKRASVAVDRTAPIPDGLDRPDGVVIEVIDKGIGIPLSHQQRVFERFYQVDDARSGTGAKRGTGLGLAIVKHAAKRLGGSVQLESVHQEGTTITIQLPRCVD